MTATTTGTCPTCGGVWLYALTFAHTNDCWLRAQDDGRRSADAEMLVGTEEFARPATAAEQTLAAALGWPGPVATFGDEPSRATVWTLVVGPPSLARRQLHTVHGGVRGPVWDPDLITTTDDPEETAA